MQREIQTPPSGLPLQSAPESTDPLFSPAQFLVTAREMGVSQFIRDNPKFDGRGTAVAIIDRTPDLLSKHLQYAISSDGKRIPKFADVLVTNDPVDEPRNSRVENKRWAAVFEKPEAGVWEIVLRNAPDARESDKTRPKPLPPTPVNLTVSLVGSVDKKQQ
jgi:hypothetical protein